MKLRLSLCLSILVFAACRCEGPNPTRAEADLAVAPKALAFNACPTLDSSGAAVADVFPDEQVFTLSNIGRGTGTLSRFEIVGADPAIQQIFTIAADKKPTEIPAATDLEIPVRFSPKKAGDVSADVVIDDADESTEPIRVTLVGTGSSLPAQPTLKVTFESDPGSDQFQVCDPSVLANCAPTWPDTFYGQGKTLTLKVKNDGCPALKVTGVEIKKAPSSLEDLAYFLDAPVVAPSAASPVQLTSAGGNDELTLKVRFQPERDALSPGDGQRYAILVVTTNDPAQPTLEILLQGVGVQPDVYSVPSFCNFTDNADGCGNTPKVANKAKFAISNGGNTPILIKTNRLANGGVGGRFTISTSVEGKTIVPGSREFLEITYVDAPLFVSEQLIVSAVASADQTQNAGEAMITLAGGILPKLSTDPANDLEFKNATTAVSTKTIAIKNGAGAGVLIINRVAIDQPDNFFTVVAPEIPAGTQVPAGGQVLATIQYKKPVSGGAQVGTLRIDTNDPDYGPPPYKVVLLRSDAPLDQLPVAVLQGPQQQTTNMSVKLASITGVPKLMLLSGVASYDLQPDGSKAPVKDYWFQLLRKPGNATAGSLENNAVKTGTSTATLTFDPTAVGEYWVGLRVYDSADQASAAMDILKISVQQ